MKILKYLFTALVVVSMAIPARADEGMWLPQLLQKLNESKMKSLGMKISARDIYSINSGSLKDAVVSFGGFCTGELISSKGLILTNHHCGFDAIQNHSSVENNYLKNGFWAKDHSEEIANPGLFVTFIVRIDDVSAQVMKGVTDRMSESERQSAIDKNLAEVRKNVKKEQHQESFVRGFFEGNQYYLFVTETYRDVRLVGAPPSAIGNFGVDSDNWMWPRHTGDFSMFRIYAGKDNKPAEYSKENVPFTPKKSFSISLDGVEEGDFTMIFGFPGRTMQYLHSAAVEQIVKVNDPAKIAIRAKAIDVLGRYMRADEKTKIQYAAKYASIQNAYKKWQGEVLGLTRTNAVEKKKKYEAIFQQRINADPALKASYGTLLSDLESVYRSLEPLGLARDYYQEIMSKMELFSIAANLNSLVTAYEKEGEAGYNKRLATVKNNLKNIYGEYNPEVDRRVVEALLEMYAAQPETFVAPSLKQALATNNGSAQATALALYEQTSMDDDDAITALLNKPAADVIAALKADRTASLFSEIQRTYQGKVQSELNGIQDNINRLQRIYMKAQMEVMKEKVFYPDANSTLRLAYGNVRGYAPRDAVKYEYYTDLDGLMQKYVPGDYEFDVPEKLRMLWANKDYGRYARKDGRMPVNFIATNHTTGGNSGSPALDAYGNLVGINFDRVWEGTMSDINFDPTLCRNIMVDIRYVLFIVDKYAGAKHLIDEMKIVHPKTGGNK